MPAEAPAWSGGWLREARHEASPNRGSRPVGALVDLIVVHAISLPPGRYDGPAIIDLFMNRLDWQAHPYYEAIRGLQVSAHFLIRRDGELWQFVSTDDRAWHAGVSRYRGRDNCNDDSIGIELEGLDGDRFEAAQYATLARLCLALAHRHPIRFIAGHEHVAPHRKRDPGPGFDWSRLIRDLGWSDRCFPEGVHRNGTVPEPPVR